MTFTRLFLLATGGFTLAAGLVFMVRPATVAALADLSLTSPLAVIEIQGFYGGQLAGAGIAILLALWSHRLVAPALVLLAATLGGTAVGRLYGVATTGVCPPIIAGFMALEAGTAIVAGVLFARADRS